MSNVIEITEKMQLEERIIKKEGRLEIMLKSMLRGMPYPAWIITEEFRIVEQNELALTIFGRKIGDCCWKDRSETETGFFDKYKNLLINEPINEEIELSGVVWDTCWIPLEENLYLYYAANITGNKKAEDDLCKSSIADSLTHIYNRKHFTKCLENQVKTSFEKEISFSIIMFEVDNFKKINETYGYDVADLALKKCTKEILKCDIRKVDSFARWGGKEFILMLPGVTIERAAILAESFRKRINQIDINHIVGLTASFGVTEYAVGEEVEELLERADDMMQKARKEGRNCVRCTKRTTEENA